MSDRHLFSDPLYELLFRHNLVSSDGYVTANEQELKQFSAFLARKCREKTAEIFKERKEIVDEILHIVQVGNIGLRELKRITYLLFRLNIGITRDGQLVKLELPKIKEKNLGSPEPNQSYWERKYLAEFTSKKIRRRELKVLDDWLEEISRPGVKVDKTPYIHSKENERRYRARTANRMENLERGRKQLVESYYKKKEEKKKPEESYSEDFEDPSLPSRSSLSTPKNICIGSCTKPSSVDE